LSYEPSCTSAFRTGLRVGTTTSMPVTLLLTLKRKPLAEYLFDHYGLVVLLILGAVYQRHVAALSCGNERG
jgi:hypothetical protein